MNLSLVWLSLGVVFETARLMIFQSFVLCIGNTQPLNGRVFLIEWRSSPVTGQKNITRELVCDDYKFTYPNYW